MYKRKAKTRIGTIDRETAEFRRISKEEKMPFRIEDAPRPIAVQPPVSKEERRKTQIRMIRELADKRPGAFVISYRTAKIAKRTADGVRILPVTPETLKRLRQETEKRRREEDRRIKGFEKKHKKKLR